MSGIECYQLNLTPLPEADPDDLAALFQTDALVITLPASRTVEGADNYFLAVQQVVDSALAAAIPRIIFTSSMSVYDEGPGVRREESTTAFSPAGTCWSSWKTGCINCPIRRWIFCGWRGLVGPGRHPGRFLAGKQGLPGGGQGVNLVHLADVISAITQLPRRPSLQFVRACARRGVPPSVIIIRRWPARWASNSPSIWRTPARQRGKLSTAAGFARSWGLTISILIPPGCRWPDVEY